MKRSLLFLIIFSFLTFLTFSQQNNDRIIASVGNHNIKLSQFNERYANYLFATGGKDNLLVRKAILNNMINELLLYYYDSNEKVLNDPDYQKEIKENRKRVILAYLKDKEIYAKITVNDQEVREAFSRVNEKLAARHLYAKTEEEANNLYELVKMGVDFNSLAKQVFTDSVLQNNGGYIGYFTWGDMDPAFEDVAYSLKVGEISKPVKTAQGYSIIKLEDRISNPLLTESEFQNKKSHLIDVIRMRKKDPAEKEYLNSVFDGTRLTFNNEILEKMLGDLFRKNDIESDNQKFQSEQCVKYKDRIYTAAEIEQKLSGLSSSYKEKINSVETLIAAIKGVLINDILFNIAKSKGYDTTHVVLDKLDKYNMITYLEHKKSEIVSNAQLPDSVVFSYYKDNIFSFSTERELNLQEILVNSEELANSIKELINQGSDFGELAKKYSLRKWSADNNGIMGFAPVTKFGSYKDLFWNAKVGEIIGPVEIQSVYGIFRLLGKVDGKPIDFNNIKSEVIKACQFENETDILRDYLNKLRSKVEVNINNDLLNFDAIEK